MDDDDKDCFSAFINKEKARRPCGLSCGRGGDGFHPSPGAWRWMIGA